MANETETQIDVLSWAQTYEERIQYIRTSSGAQIREDCARILADERLPYAYIESLTAEEKTIALRACLMCWTVTEAHLVPREMQLRVVVADRQGRNTLVSAGTGSGKTLPIALNILLDDPSEDILTITLSPLKRLQVTQVDDFNVKLTIRTLAINDDTPRQESWWLASCSWSILLFLVLKIFQENIFLRKKKKILVQHLIVTVEQLFKSKEGHMPRLGDMVRDIRQPAFRNAVVRINVDEAHFIYAAGQPHFGSEAFRPAWGMLDELQRQLPNRVKWHLFSATFPPHILQFVRSQLLSNDHVYIHLSSNRPNIMYATHLVEDSVDTVENYRCFLVSPFNIATQPHVLIFVNNTDHAGAIQQYLDSCLPPAHRKGHRRFGVVMYYHSEMSPTYLTDTHNDFVSPTGTCRILIATSSQSVGVDFPNVKIVCAAGLPSSLVDTLQRAGRAIRTGSGYALFVLFYPRWALEINQDDYNENKIAFKNDPDRPRTAINHHSNQEKRAPLSLISLIQSSTCIRKIFAEYLDDKTAEALEATGPFCCDRHDDGFVLEDHLPSSLYKKSPGTKRGNVDEPSESDSNLEESSESNEDDTSQADSDAGSKAQLDPKDPKVPPRTKADRMVLDPKLVDWVFDELKHNNPLNRPFYDILSHANRKKLARFPSTSPHLASPLAITQVLDETNEWAARHSHSLYAVINQHDDDARGEKLAALARTTAARMKHVAFTTDEFIISTSESFSKALEEYDEETDLEVPIDTNKRRKV